MPKILMINGYQISIWSNEKGEPVHIHISKKRPSPNSTKLWLSSKGYFVKSNLNDHRIPDNDMRTITEKLNANVDFIRSTWLAYHGYLKYFDED